MASKQVFSYSSPTYAKLYTIRIILCCNKIEINSKLALLKELDDKYDKKIHYKTYITSKRILP